MSRLFSVLPLCAFALLLGLAAPPANAAADAEAEAVLRGHLEALSAIVAEKDKPRSEREEALRELLHEALAVRRISFYVLGPYARRADKGLRKELLELLERYTLTVYARRMLGFNISDIDLEITASRKKGSKGKEAIVSTRLSGGSFEEPFDLEWWMVRDKDGTYKIFNLGFEGIWVAQEQRNSFISIIQKAGGEIRALATYLAKAIAEANNLASTPPARPE